MLDLSKAIQCAVLISNNSSTIQSSIIYREWGTLYVKRPDVKLVNGVTPIRANIIFGDNSILAFFEISVLKVKPFLITLSDSKP